jgi:hypothetical protein
MSSSIVCYPFRVGSFADDLLRSRVLRCQRTRGSGDHHRVSLVSSTSICRTAIVQFAAGFIRRRVILTFRISAGRNQR